MASISSTDLSWAHSIDFHQNPFHIHLIRSKTKLIYYIVRYILIKCKYICIGFIVHNGKLERCVCVCRECVTILSTHWRSDFIKNVLQSIFNWENRTMMRNRKGFEKNYYPKAQTLQNPQKWWRAVTELLRNNVRWDLFPTRPSGNSKNTFEK